MVETVITGLSDEFPQYLRKYKIIFTACLCTFCFLIGIILVTEVSMRYPKRYCFPRPNKRFSCFVQEFLFNKKYM